MTYWAAPHRTDPLDASISLPGSKSLTNRELILAALADGPSRIRRPLASRDSQLMADALRALGASIEAEDDVWSVTPISETEIGDVEIDCGLAGTVMRFAPPVAALVSGTIHFDGDPRARERPMAQILQALRDLGVSISDDSRGSLPFTVRSTGAPAGGIVEIDASSSSQFVSALLLAGARFSEGIEVRHVGTTLPSRPHIDMTIATLQARGVQVSEPTSTSWVVEPVPIAALDVDIEPDLSNAGPFIAAALVTGGRVRVEGWPETTTQAGDAWREIIAKFGGTAKHDGHDLVVTGPSELKPIDVDLSDVGELTPVIAAVCAVANGTSRLSGIAHLRGHETDRLAALAQEINALGGAVTETDDGLIIEAQPLHAGKFATYHDHRMAHAAVVLGLVIDGVEVENIDTTAKTYPAFAADWERFTA